MSDNNTTRPVISRKDAKDRNLRRYFTGKPCPKGHIAERLVKKGACVECRNEYSKRYRVENHESCLEREKKFREANRDIILERVKIYQRNNRDKVLARVRKYQRDNREKVLQQRRDWYVENRERILKNIKERYKINREKLVERSRNYRFRNLEKVSANYRRWRLKNPEKSAANTRNNHARRRKATGKHSARDVQEIKEKQNGKCAVCFINVKTQTKSTREGDFARLHVDHVIPIVRGGSNWPENLQILCSTCNTSKGAKLMHEWLGSDFESRIANGDFHYLKSRFKCEKV